MNKEITQIDLYNLIHEWHHYILSFKKHKATSSKEFLDNSVDVKKILNSSDKLNTLYRLMSSKHNLTFNENTLQDKTNLWGQNQESTLDDSIEILIHDYAGQLAFQNEEYSVAIKHYQKVESLLHTVEDTFEKADFLKRIGILYYRLDETLIASLYLERAKDIFSTDFFYKLNEISCRLLLASILSETLNFQEAEEKYTELLEESLFVTDMNFFCLRSFGMHLIRSNQLEKAERTFTTLLCEEEFSLSVNNNLFVTQNKINLANILFKQSRYTEAYTFLEQGIEALANHKDFEYNCRSQFLYSLYVNFDIEAVNKQINNFLVANMTYEASELSADVACFYSSKGNFLEAYKYMELSRDYKTLRKVTLEKEVSI